MRCHDLQSEQDAAHADTKKFQDVVFITSPEKVGNTFFFNAHTEPVGNTFFFNAHTQQDKNEKYYQNTKYAEKR